MKKHNLIRQLQIAEGVSVLGGIVGTITSIITNQVAYASLPITLALSLNIVNRSKRLSETERRLQAEVTQVVKSTSSLQASFQQNLAPINEHSMKLQEDVQAKLAHLNARIDLLNIPEPVDLAPLTTSIQQLQSSIARLEQNIDNKADSAHVDDLNERVGNSVYQLSLAPLAECVQQLQSSVARLGQNIDTKADSTHVDDLTTALASLTERVDNLLHQLSLAPKSMAINGILEIIEKIKNNFNSLQQQFDYQQSQAQAMQQSIADLDSNIHSTRNDNRNLNEIINKIFTRLDSFSAFDEAGLQLKLNEVNEHITQQLSDFDNRFDGINELLKNINAYEYKLIFDRPASREQLIHALKSVKNHLILVCPWISEHGFDDEVIELFYACLQDGVKIDVGWGYLRDIESKNINCENIANSNFKGLNNGFPILMELADNNPEQIRLKLLGTHEKYLVCDESFVMLSSHNFLTSGNTSKEREVGLLTDDTRIIRQLINRFNAAPDLTSCKFSS